MKKILKYQLLDLKNVFLVFYLVYVAVFIFSALATDRINLVVMGKSFSVNGLEFSGILVSFVTGLAMFKEHFLLLAQNGVSRKMFFRCSLITSFIFSIGMSIVNFVIVSVLNLSSGYKYLLLMDLIYPAYNSFSASFINVIYSLAIFFLSFVIGLFISLCFYKANKIVKILIAAGIPISLFMIAPMSFSFMSDFWLKLFDLFYLVMGLKHGNPFIGIATFCVTSVVLIFISQPIIRRTHIV